MDRSQLPSSNSANSEIDAVRNLLFGNNADLPTSRHSVDGQPRYDSPFEEDNDPEEEEEISLQLDMLEDRLRGFECLLFDEDEAFETPDSEDDGQELKDRIQRIAQEISSISDDKKRSALGHFLIELGLNVQPGKE